MNAKSKQQREIAIRLKGVTKQYVLHHEKPTFIENVIRRRKQETFTALNNIDLTIYKGEKIGIIGPNGSGKTTLLKIISGITTPNKGEVFTKGKIVSLIDLEAGFHLDLTGEENIFLNGLLVGMSRQEIRRKYRDIVKFAGVEKFIDAPLHTYSEGMKLRLGFSIAVHADPDILIVDEVITVGDEKFQKKANEKIKNIFKNKTVLVVTHWLSFLDNNCQRIIWFQDGKIFTDGGKSMLNRYHSMNNKIK